MESRSLPYRFPRGSLKGGPVRKKQTGTWGDFEIDFSDPLGSGGMGTVYPARQISLNRPVAVKVVHEQAPTGMTDRAPIDEGFHREVRALSRIRETRIPHIIQAGCEKGRPWFAMERFEGESLEARMRRKPVSRVEAFRIAREVAYALKSAWDSGFLHRDVKPGNIFLSRDGSVVLLDWGLSEPEFLPSLRDSLQCTPAYTAPEYLLGERTDWRSDMYSLGVVLYEMITGQPPFPFRASLEIVDLVCQEKGPYEISARPEMRILRRCLKRNPEERYPTPGDFLKALRFNRGNHVMGFLSSLMFAPVLYILPTLFPRWSISTGSS